MTVFESDIANGWFTSKDGFDVDEHPGLRGAFMAYVRLDSEKPQEWICPECGHSYTFTTKV